MWSCLGPYTYTLAVGGPGSDGAGGGHVGIGRPGRPRRGGARLPVAVGLVGWRPGFVATAVGRRRRRAASASPLPVVSNFTFGLVWFGCLPCPSPLLPLRPLRLDRPDCSSVPSQLTLPRRARLPPFPPSASRIYTRAARLPPLPCTPLPDPPRPTRSAPRPFHAAAAVPLGWWLIGRNSAGRVQRRLPSIARPAGFRELAEVRWPYFIPRSCRHYDLAE